MPPDLIMKVIMSRVRGSNLFMATVIGRFSFILAMSLIGACGEQSPPPAPAPEIRVVEVIQRDQPVFTELVGETHGAADVPIRARVEGALLGLHFTEGATVAKGDLLYTIDPTPYETLVVEAEVYLAQAQIRVADENADLARIRPLVEIGAASEMELDSAVAQYEAAVGGVRAAEARVQREKIRLGYTRIEAPIDGRIGMTAAKPGEFVGSPPNPMVLNSISDVDPIRVRFTLDERNYIRLARKRVTQGLGEAVEDKNPESKFELILADGTLHTHRGRLVATDEKINRDTGTFTAEAEFPNPDELVLAGQFARVRVEIDRLENAILVPQRAIRELQGIFQVYVVDADGSISLRVVEPGYKIDRLQVIEKGLESGEQIAIEIARLRSDMTIVPRLTQLNQDGSVVEESAPADPVNRPAEKGP